MEGERQAAVGCGERRARAAISEDARSGPMSDRRRLLLELHRAAEVCLCVQQRVGCWLWLRSARLASGVSIQLMLRIICEAQTDGRAPFTGCPHPLPPRLVRTERERWLKLRGCARRNEKERNEWRERDETQHNERRAWCVSGRCCANEMR